MSRFSALAVTILVVIKLSATQVPPRLQIPGAILLGQPRPGPFRQGRLLNQDVGPPPRLRARPIPPPQPAPIRPVVEENEDILPSTPAVPPTSVFDDEVNKLGLSVLQSAIRQANDQEEELPTPTNPAPLPFRPEKSLPLLRENIRDKSVLRQEIQRPRPIPTEEPLIVRQPPPRPKPVPIEEPQNIRQPIARTRPIPTEEPQIVRQPGRQYSARQQAAQAAAPPPQTYRPQPRPPPPARQPSQYLDEDGHRGRTRKPPVQILRKYRTDNPDGSITWGYENEDGSFKEETLGTDCTTRGKYGYIDPDGVRREYSYETGNKCDHPELEEEQELPQSKQPHVKKPQSRPAPIQYANN